MTHVILNYSSRQVCKITMLPNAFVRSSGCRTTGHLLHVGYCMPIHALAWIIMYVYIIIHAKAWIIMLGIQNSSFVQRGAMDILFVNNINNNLIKNLELVQDSITHTGKLLYFYLICILSFDK